MTRILALCSTSLIPLLVGAAPTHALAAPPNVVLVNQNNYPNSQYAFVSDNFTDGTFTSYDSYGADDFVVPAGHRWRIKEMDVTGIYATGSAASSETVLFYKNKGSFPGTLVAECENIKGLDKEGSFTIPIPDTCKISLRGGKTYWVSVVANISFGLWYWQTRIKEKQNPAVWENPSNIDGTGCRTWNTLAYCSNSNAGPDFMFALRGVDRATKEVRIPGLGHRGTN